MSDDLKIKTARGSFAILFSVLCFVLLSGCVQRPDKQDLQAGDGHNLDGKANSSGRASVNGGKKDSVKQKKTAAQKDESQIPALATTTSFLMPEGSRPSLNTYTVTVTDAPLREVIFALARDADLNIDVYPGITGKITINAIEQTLPTILDRISEYANLTYQITESSIIISPDLPYRRSYRLNYIQNKRSMSSKMTVSTRVASSSQSGTNTSEVSLNTDSNVDFWTDIVENVSGILGVAKGEMDKGGPQKVVWNRATGVINVLASDRQHKEVQKFFDTVMRDAQKQVFIEAVIVEVKLSDKFQAGVDWSLFASDCSEDGTNAQSLMNSRVNSAPNLALKLARTKIPFASGVIGNANMSATVRMLSQFGNTKVLSTPRITVLNNQTAVLRVTTNQVYFQIKVTPPQYSDGVLVSAAQPETTIRTVPIGFIMQVTPQISENDVISLNIRPTIQRVSEWVENPDPNLRTNLIDGVTYTPPKVPVIQVQEMDSMLRVSSGQVAVMGGLMENSFNKSMDGVPYLSKLPLLGSLFSFRNREDVKKELVIFLRPIIATEADDIEKFTGGELFVSRNEGVVKSFRKLGIDTQ